MQIFIPDAEITTPLRVPPLRQRVYLQSYVKATILRRGPQDRLSKYATPDPLSGIYWCPPAQVL